MPYAAFEAHGGRRDVTLELVLCFGSDTYEVASTYTESSASRQDCPLVRGFQMPVPNFIPRARSLLVRAPTRAPR